MKDYKDHSVGRLLKPGALASKIWQSLQSLRKECITITYIIIIIIIIIIIKASNHISFINPRQITVGKELSHHYLSCSTVL
jgi:hypothetical protein